MNDTGPHSARFRRAAIAESERLLRRQGRAIERVSIFEKKLAEAKRELAQILDRVEKLRSLTGETGGPRPVEAAPPPAGIPISGAEIRKVAVRLFRESGAADQPIHYRQWLQLVEDAGYSVRGKRPEAVFLGQLVRSPAVKSTTQSGYYELDREAPERLRGQIATFEQEAFQASTSRPQAPAEIERRIVSERERSGEIRRLQRSLREALEVLGDPVIPAEQVAA